MVLVDHQIREQVKKGHLGIDNFDDNCVQPASYDLRIGPLLYSPASPTPDKPIDLSVNGGAHRIPPYGSVILMTLETLQMPNNIVGRIGLKSGFARRGLFASAGPQVDPGFHGKLFISILNLMPASQVVAYKDTFLSIEFQKLDQPPDKTYDGPYQHKLDIGPEILEDLTRLEGLNLSQMQNQFMDLSRHVQEWSGLANRFEEFLKEMGRQTNAIIELGKQMTEVVKGTQISQEIATRQIDPKQAKAEILELFKKRKKLFYSDISDELNLDYATIIQACAELQKEGRIEGENDAKKRSKRSGN
jgi:dCTP deaminase